MSSIYALSPRDRSVDSNSETCSILCGIPRHNFAKSLLEDSVINPTIRIYHNLLSKYYFFGLSLEMGFNIGLFLIQRYNRSLREAYLLQYRIFCNTTWRGSVMQKERNPVDHDVLVCHRPQKKSQPSRLTHASEYLLMCQHKPQHEWNRDLADRHKDHDGLCNSRTMEVHRKVRNKIGNMHAENQK